MHILFLILIGAGAGFVQRVSGFGLGIFAMLFLPHFMPSHMQAAAISSIFSLGTSSFNAIKYRKNIDYKTVFPMLISALVTTTVAVWFSAKVTAGIFELLLGLVLIILSLYFLFFSSKISIKPNLANSITSGTLSGVLSGLFSTGGPPAVLYLTNATPDKMVYFASIQFFFSMTNVYATAVRAVSGVITADVIVYSLIGLIGCMAGDFLGKIVFSRLNSEKLKKIIYRAMIISGILMLI